MQDFVEGWCALIGVTDPVAVSFATGALAVSALWVAGYLAILAVLHGIAALFS